MNRIYQCLGASGLAACLMGICGQVPQATAQCQQVSVPATSYSSWDMSGHENKVHIEEKKYPDSLAGKGPGYTVYPALKTSYHILGFPVPQFTGTVVGAELRLKIRNLNSLLGSETYQVHKLTSPQVKLLLHQRLGPVIYEDLTTNMIYGTGALVLGQSTAKFGLNEALVAALNAATNRVLLLEGSLTSLDSDLYNPQYFYLQTGVAGYAELVCTLSNNLAPALVSPLAGGNAPAGADTEFHVLACGEPPLSYAWWHNGQPLAGEMGASLLLRNLSKGHEGSYTVVVSNAHGVSPSSGTLAVASRPPFFAIQPSNLTAVVGRTGTFLRAVANAAPPASYQWQLEGQDISGATNSILPLDPITPATEGLYSVIAWNDCGLPSCTVTSVSARVEVVPFSLQGPSDQTVLLGNSGGLYVYIYDYAAARPTGWRWYKDGAQIPGATNSYYSFIAQFSDTGDYYAVADSAYGAVTSRVAYVAVQTQRPLIYSLLYGQSLVAGLTNTLAFAASGGPPPTYFWYRDNTLICITNVPRLSLAPTLPSDAGYYRVVASNEIDTATTEAQIDVIAATVSVGPTELSVGEGRPALFQGYYQSVQPVSLQWLFNGEPLAGEHYTALVVPSASLAQAGNYYLVVTNIYGCTTSMPVHLSVSSVPTNVSLITSQEITNRIGDFVTIAATVGGGPRPACQWLFNGAEIPGATNDNLALTSISLEHAGEYVLAYQAGEATERTLPVRLTVMPVGPLDQWTQLNPLPQANQLRSIATGDGRRVAIGDQGAVAVSTNGQTWVARQIPGDLRLNAVAYGNGVFVAVGEIAPAPWQVVPLLLCSADGLEWTSCGVSGAGSLLTVAFGDGKFVATGARDPSCIGCGSSVFVLFTSTNGLDWSKIYPAGEMGARWCPALCFGNGRFVAIASDNGLVSSPDLVHWTSGQIIPVWVNAVAAGPDAFIAVGNQGVFARSTDGITWSTGFFDYSASQMNSVVYGNGQYVACGNNGAAFVSSDGQSWQAALRPTAHDMRGVAFGGGQFTAVCDAGRIFASTDGATWSDQCLGSDLDIYGLAASPSGYVAVADGGTLYSAESLNWAALPFSQKLHAITYGNGLFVSGGKRGVVMTSTDGSNWFAQATTTTAYLESATWANGRFVVVGEGGTIITSPDGTNWTTVASASIPLTPADLEGVAYGNGLFVAVGGYFGANGAVATVVTSPDGIHWTDQPYVGFFGVRIRSVTFGNGVFMLVGNDGLTAVSTNGLYWQEHYVPDWQNLRSVAFAAGHFIAVGNEGTVFSSVDGAAWVTHRCPARMNLRHVVADDNTVVVIGSNGEIIRSGRLLPTLLPRIAGEQIELTIERGFATEYRIQASDDLQSWTTVWSCTNQPGSRCYLEPIGGDVKARFYRVLAW